MSVETTEPTLFDETPDPGPTDGAAYVVPPEESVDTGSAELAVEPERSVEDRLLDEPAGPLTLSTGLEVEIRPLKLREFLKLLKIMTRGGASVMSGITFDFDNPQNFTQDLLALILFAVPEAEDEVAEFLEAICKPTGLTGDPKKDQEKFTLLVETFDNPELEDALDVLTLLVRTEGRDLASLGKRLRAMLNVAQKMGATK